MAQGDDAVAWARTQIGKPYAWATAGPATYDCSGLVYAAYQHIKPKAYVGRTTYEQILIGSAVKLDDLAVGDLVFPYADISHVALYSGGGNIIEAPRSGTVVREGPIYKFFTARRVGTVSGDDGGVDLSGLVSGFANVPGIPNPFDPGGHPIDPGDIPIVGGFITAGEAASQTTFNLATFMRTITSKIFWLRFATVTGGIALIIWGISFLNRGLVFGPMNTIRQKGGELLGMGTQGLAFGVGAGGLNNSPRGTADNPASITGAPPSQRALGGTGPAPSLSGPSGLTNEEWARRYGVTPDSGRFGKQENFPPPHKNPPSKGGRLP